MSTPPAGAQRETVLATLADQNYVEQAKQLFSSAHFNAGWKGDYLLLAHDIDERDLEWFESRGILVHRCEPLYEGMPGGMPPVLASKFHLFTERFKAWKTVVYTDADATIRASLDDLIRLRGFWSIKDISRWLELQIVSSESVAKRGIARHVHRRLTSEIKRRYGLRRAPFCAGFFVFSTDLIDENVFAKLKATMDRFHIVSEYGDQLSFNLVFADRWQVLPPVFNMQVTGEENQWHLPASEIDGIVLHFISAKKPWVVKSHFYEEWLGNLDRSASIDLTRIPEGKRWSSDRIHEHSRWLGTIDQPPSYYRAVVNRVVKHRVPFDVLPIVLPLWRLAWGTLSKYSKRRPDNPDEWAAFRLAVGS